MTTINTDTQIHEGDEFRIMISGRIMFEGIAESDTFADEVLAECMRLTILATNNILITPQAKVIKLS
jgi:hypothetical protein